jgi:8-oxo-dGTP pyrophosphatase MutT (NUDIX family)
VNPVSLRPEAILVRSRYSYGFAEFVLGRYSRKNVGAVVGLLHGMSVDEQLDVYSLNFHQMWYRVWLTPGGCELFRAKLAIFQTRWIKKDGGGYLRRLVQAAIAAPRRGGDSRWGFPKGRKCSAGETDLCCALREFEEETGISRREFHLVSDYTRRTISSPVGGVCYETVYFVAVARQPRVGPRRSLLQVAEVAEVRWMDIDQIRLLGSPAPLEETIAPVFKRVECLHAGRAERDVSNWRRPSLATTAVGGVGGFDLE